jgi:dTDP-4-amino-4,6-dideoxygalactose transaminase
MISLNSPNKDSARQRSEIFRAIKSVIKGSLYILGEQVNEFEDNFAQKIGAAGCVGVANGTDAITLALMGIGVKEGDEVLVVGNTALASIAGIIRSGATPVIVDVDTATALISYDKIETLLTNKTKAILVVHLFGNPVDVFAIKKILKRRDIKIIEDCAQAHGAKIADRYVGTIGDIGCFSFYPTKILGAIGDAGCVVSNSELYLENVRQLRQYGWNLDRIAEKSIGINSRLDEIQAAILNIKLRRFEQNFEVRNKIANYYLQNLDTTKFTNFEIISNGTHAYHLFVGKVSNRESVMKELQSKGIATGIYYENTILDHPGYQRHIKSAPSGTPNSKKLSKQIMSIPMNNYMSMSETKKIVAAVNGALKS